MAKFTCDICGGTIKMQANRTCVCQECGMEYDIEAIKAMINNNTSSSSVSSPVSRRPNKQISDSEVKPINRSKTSAVDYPLNSVTPNNREIDRNALLIYLNNVRTLETIIEKSKEKHDEIADEAMSKNSDLRELQHIASSKQPELPDEIPEPEKPIKPQEPHSSLYRILAIFFFTISILILIVSFITLKGTLIGGSIKPIIFILFSFLGPGIIFCVLIYREKNKYQKAKFEYYRKLEKYETEIKEYELNVRRATINYKAQIVKKLNIKENEYKKIETARDNLKAELNKFCKLLDNAYNANIIPLQFRNIEGVYYLYDYLSSSNQTLSEALMQANLEVIKQKLDNMIKLQAANVIQQAQANAKLDNIVQQNTQILKTAERTAANTELAAKYAAISAVNSEITKQLSQEQLAYQKADFWLK